MLNKNFFDKYEAVRFVKDLQRDKIIFERTRRKDMKAYLFVPTGEVRVPREKEFILILGLLREAPLNVFGAAYPIYTRHAIEIPDYAHSLQINAIYGTGNIQSFYAELIRFPICQKKPKVKKWKWASGGGGQVMVTVVGYLSEREVNDYQKQFPNFWYHKLDETEIEVEE